jgi:hypothetical protein
MTQSVKVSDLYTLAHGCNITLRAPYHHPAHFWLHLCTSPPWKSKLMCKDHLLRFPNHCRPRSDNINIHSRMPYSQPTRKLQSLFALSLPSREPAYVQDILYPASGFRILLLRRTSAYESVMMMRSLPLLLFQQKEYCSQVRYGEDTNRHHLIFRAKTRNWEATGIAW